MSEEITRLKIEVEEIRLGKKIPIMSERVPGSSLVEQRKESVNSKPTVS